MSEEHLSDRNNGAPLWVVWLLLAGVVIAGLAGVALGAIGFPREKIVEKPVEITVEKRVEVPVEKVVEKIVEKIVDRPVEVVRMVDKIVKVPAELTPEQKSAVVFAGRIFDPTQANAGVSLFKLSDRILVTSALSGDGSRNISTGLIIARVESAFRQQGFRVVSSDSKEYPFSIAEVGGVFLEGRDTYGKILSVSGSYNITISQPVTYFNNWDNSGVDKMVLKRGMLPLYHKGGSLNYGSLHFGEIPDVFGKMAEAAANELRKANDN